MTKPIFLYKKEHLPIYDLFLMLYSITAFYSISFLLYFVPANSIGDGTLLEFLNNSLKIFLSLINILSFFLLLFFGFFIQDFSSKKYITIISMQFIIGLLVSLNINDNFLPTFEFHFDLILKAYFITIFTVYFLLKNNIFIQKLAKASVYFYIFVFAFLGMMYSASKTTMDLIRIDDTSFAKSIPYQCEDRYIKFNGYLNYEIVNCPYSNLSEMDRLRKYSESGSIYSYWMYTGMLKRSNSQSIDELIGTTEKNIYNNTKIYNSWLYQNIPSIVDQSTYPFYKERIEKENNINIQTIEFLKSQKIELMQRYIENTKERTHLQTILYKKYFKELTLN